MATKTIVCPECQAPAGPGRYACAQCGALLASVALAPRPQGRAGREAVVDVAPAEAAPPALAPSLVEQATDVLVADRPRRTRVAPAWTQGLAAEPIESAPGVDERWDDQPPTAEAAAEPVPAERPMENDLEADHGVTVEPIAALVNRATNGLGPKRATEKKAPSIAAIKPAPLPKVRRRSTPDPAALERIAPLAVPQPDVEPAAVATPEPAVLASVEPVARAAPEPAVLATPEPATPAVLATPEPATPAASERASLAVAPPAVTPRVERAQTVQPPPRFELAPASKPASRVEVAPRREAVPAWPPPGDRGPLVEPLPRVPAGVYLPPSAVLPSGEALPIAGATNGRPATVPAVPDAATSDGASKGVSAADRLAQLDLPEDTPRRVVAIGAVVAALGFLLPWSTSPTGSDLLGDYWVRWGMAGPGAWIVVALLIGLAGLTLAGGRLASAPVGLPGVALAMLLLGLSWPYLFGVPGRTVGIWVVLAGVILLAVGGLLDMRAGRHGDSQPTV
jgi:hypothetical protein